MLLRDLQITAVVSSGSVRICLAHVWQDLNRGRTWYLRKSIPITFILQITFLPSAHVTFRINVHHFFLFLDPLITRISKLLWWHPLQVNSATQTIHCVCKMPEKMLFRSLGLNEKIFVPVICMKFKLGYSSRKAFRCITFSTVYSLQLLNIMVARNLSWFSGPSQIHFHIRRYSYLSQSGCSSSTSVLNFSKVQLVVYYQCCVLIGWAATRLYVIAH